MENTSTGVGPEQSVKASSGLLRLSLATNVALIIVVIALAAWGWGRHVQVKERDRQVAELDKQVAAANQERDEAYQVSRDLQYGLIKARGELKGFSETLKPPATGDTQDPDSPP
jgi:uncharacterized protein HemX